MDLRDFYRLLLRNLIPVLICVFFGVGIAGAITLTMEKEYTAQAVLFVSTPRSSVDIGLLATGSNFTQQRVKTYANIVNGPATLNPVIEELGLNTTWDKLAKKIKANAPLDTALINLSVTDGDPVLAASIANAVGKQFETTAGQLEVQESSGGSPVKVTLAKYAIAPRSPSQPVWGLNILIGLLIGFGIGVTIGIVRQVFDSSIKNEEQIDGLSLLGAVGFDPNAAEQPLITMVKNFSPRAESYRHLRTNLEFLHEEEPPQVIAIASPLPGEGKTTTVLNLGLALTEANYKVLCLEADLRRPTIRKYLKCEEAPAGLSEILSGKIPCDNRDAINATIRFDKNSRLHLLTAGKNADNPSVLLHSTNFEKLISILRKDFDFILIDSPPLLPVTDGGLIASKADGAVLVIRAGVTRLNQFRGARDALNRVGANVLGVVLNMIPLVRNGEDYGYRYGYSYGYRRYNEVYGASDYSYSDVDLPDSSDSRRGRVFKDTRDQN